MHRTASSMPDAVPARLSAMQRAIMAVLPEPDGQPVRTGVILTALSLHNPSASERAAVSRSLVRLEARGLARRQFDPGGSGWKRKMLWSRAGS